MKLPSDKETVILELLCGRRELFPLEMIELSGGSLGRSSIYVILGRMEGQRLVDAREVKERGTPGLPRRQYWITGLGQRALAMRRAAEAAGSEYDGGLEPQGA